MGFAYAEPRKIPTSDNLFFYHSIDLPGQTIEGDWDLRGDAHAYLGNVDYRGKRCLDMGAGSGFLSFEMEKLGASEVVSFDIGRGADWNIVPHYKKLDQMENIRRQADHSIESMKNSYWYCHGKMGSAAKAYYGDIYDLPEDLGEFDVVFYGMILTHLRDPYWALYQGARLCRDKLVITGIWRQDSQPTAVFRPSASNDTNLGIKSWWLLSTGALSNMIGSMGFEIVETVSSNVQINAKGSEGPRTCQAIVAQRIKA
ncbi:MAG: hypothetical protein RIE56_03150 [Amphiplicatus sp.]